MGSSPMRLTNDCLALYSDTTLQMVSRYEPHADHEEGVQLHSFSCLYSASYVIIKALRLIVGVMTKTLRFNNSYAHLYANFVKDR